MAAGAVPGGAVGSDLTARKSATDATAIQSSQKIIVKKRTEKIAATPAAKPNQATWRIPESH